MIKSLLGAAVAVSVISPAFAERPLSADEVESRLSGKQFSLSCVNGISGRGSYAGGIVKASYRMPAAREDAEPVQDQGSVRARGGDLCIAWRHLTGGGEGCYRVTEKAPGRYRISDGSGRWCDFAVR